MLQSHRSWERGGSSCRLQNVETSGEEHLLLHLESGTQTTKIHLQNQLKTVKVKISLWIS